MNRKALNGLIGAPSRVKRQIDCSADISLRSGQPSLSDAQLRDFAVRFGPQEVLRDVAVASGRPVFFRNSVCLACSRPLGYAAARGRFRKSGDEPALRDRLSTFLIFSAVLLWNKAKPAAAASGTSSSGANAGGV